VPFVCGLLKINQRPYNFMWRKHMKQSLRVYSTISGIFPKSKYIHKLFLVGFLSVHVPLITSLIFLLSIPQSNTWHLMGVVLAATLAGTFLAFWLLWHLLQPVILARLALNDFLILDKIPELPLCYTDEVGALMKDIVLVANGLDIKQMELNNTMLSNTKTYI
jgi:hypothetical protein